MNVVGANFELYLTNVTWWQFVVPIVDRVKLL
jgi:hypothetical protein